MTKQRHSNLNKRLFDKPGSTSPLFAFILSTYGEGFGCWAVLVRCEVWWVMEWDAVEHTHTHTHTERTQRETAREHTWEEERQIPAHWSNSRCGKVLSDLRLATVSYLRNPMWKCKDRLQALSTVFALECILIWMHSTAGKGNTDRLLFAAFSDVQIKWSLAGSSSFRSLSVSSKELKWNRNEFNMQVQ